MNNPVWSSLLFEDFQYLPDPRATPDYQDEACDAIKRLAPDSDPYEWCPLRLERSILRGWKSPQSLGEILGTRIEHHTIRYLCHLLPSLQPDPWWQEKVTAFYDAPDHLNRKVINFFGGQNSGKSSFQASMAVGLAILHPEFTRQTVSGPFKEAGEFPLWGEILTFYEEAYGEWGDKLKEWTGAKYDRKRKKWDSNPEKTSCMLEDPGRSSKGVLHFSETPKAGTIKLIAMDDVGKVQGAKSKDRAQRRGYFVIWLDEIGAGYPTMSIIRALHNLRSNKNLRVVTACNPFNPVGQLDGELGRPPQGFEALKIEEDYVWNSANGSRTYRFDGHRSPNLILGEHWPYLFNEERRETLLSATTADSDFYNSQCRGFMPMGSGNRYVLTVPDIRAGMVDAPFTWSGDQKWKVAFLDPALSTDGDNAVYTLLEGGTAALPDGQRIPISYAAKQIKIPIFTGLVATPEWVQKCEAVRGTKSRENHTLHQMIPVEEQLAINVAFQLRLDQVPYGFFGYDDSLRSKIMEAMIWAMGNEPKAVSSVGEAEDIPMYPPKHTPPDEKGKTRLVTWREDVSKFVSQYWFFGAAVVRSGFFRAHPSTMIALNEACGRFWSYTAGGKRREVESKKETKLRNSGASPDHADSLFGAIYIAQKKGLLRLKIDMPNASLHITPSGRTSYITRQWKNRRQTVGLHSTGTR